MIRTLRVISRPLVWTLKSVLLSSTARPSSFRFGTQLARNVSVRSLAVTTAVPTVLS
ncbi:hypothetical protein DD238_000594 [Peronospora effusa]|uniref:Uncharacterized protein n=1 Tax=Peronospora effusa TaxID=542832 RepID=A0A3M6VUI0_9STRA|nr:hypothetical protein DD238_000594 [Peronospora effusa]RQM18327.1 hypothetical protein DD237_000022 [Peronospora effusa]